MSTTKNGTLTVSREWAKHLRRWGKRMFWRRERQAAKQEVRREGAISL